LRSIRLAVAHLTKKEAPFWRLGGVVAVCAAIGVISMQFWAAGRTPLVEVYASQPADSNEPIQPIQPLTNLDPRKVDLGQKLFNNPRLSHNNQVSCASCHNLTTGGTDRQAKSIGINGAVGIINAPTVFNSGFNFSQFWDGRAGTLEMQIDGPLQSKIEMGSTWPEAIAKLSGSPEYVRAFRQIYGDAVKSDHVKEAIAEFERSLATPNSRFDKYLRHEANSITSRERQGYNLFASLGCSSCHQGASVGGNMYQKLGIMAPYFTDRGHISAADQGRFNVTGDPGDIYMFKVPSLRNVALTPPYFHDGSQATLPDAIRTMAKYQLGRNLSGEEVELIVEFLSTLTGELNGKPL
jgi:cytochrome c peroxidase